jgi:Tfp pilus assembly protein PilO
MKAITRHDVIWTLGIALVTSAFLLLISRPQFGKASELKQSLREERERLSEGRMDLEELPRLEAEVNKLRQQVGHFELQVPVQDQLGAYLERLAGVAQAHQLRPEAIEPGTPIRSHDLFAVPIVVKVHGPFREVYGMLKDVMTLPRLTQVQRFDTKLATDRPGEVQAELQLRVFYRAS